MWIWNKVKEASNWGSCSCFKFSMARNEKQVRYSEVLSGV